MKSRNDGQIIGYPKNYKEIRLIDDKITHCGPNNTEFDDINREYKQQKDKEQINTQEGNQEGINTREQEEEKDESINTEEEQKKDHDDAFSSWEHIRGQNFTKNLNLKNHENSKCQAILSGYMGSAEICEEVFYTVQRWKQQNKNIIYLCDPVIGGKTCHVKPEIFDVFKSNITADIITPNQSEAEALANIQICNINSLKLIAKYFHRHAIKIVIITDIKSNIDDEFINDKKSFLFLSNENNFYITKTINYDFSTPISGAGDLFSAIYLGRYLHNKNVVLALQETIYFMEQIMQNTFQKCSKELEILTVNYNDQIDKKLLKNVIKI